MTRTLVPKDQSLESVANSQQSSLNMSQKQPEKMSPPVKKNTIAAAMISVAPNFGLPKAVAVNPNLKK